MSEIYSFVHRTCNEILIVIDQLYCLAFWITIVSFATVFWDVTQRWRWGERCVTSQKTAAKETRITIELFFCI